MEEITKFKAVDGTEFTNKQECLDYESLIKRAAKIMDALPPVPENDGCSFVNGGGYIKHDKDVVISTKTTILRLMREYINHPVIQQAIDTNNVHPSHISRALGDYNLNPLSKAWYRFMCIDNQYREWGQPYFANNPEKGEQVSLNYVR